MNEMLAVISGQQLVECCVKLVVVLLIAWVLWWGIKTINPPEPGKRIAVVILVVLTTVVIVSLLLGLLGITLVQW